MDQYKGFVTLVFKHKRGEFQLKNRHKEIYDVLLITSLTYHIGIMKTIFLPFELQ